MTAPLSQQKLFPATGQQPRVVALLGSVGNGKSNALASLLRTLRDHRRDVLINDINGNLDRQYTDLASHDQTRRTPAGQTELLTIQTSHQTIQMEAWAGEDTRIGNAIHVQELMDRVLAQAVDLLGLCINPFQQDLDLGTWAFVELSWWLNEHTSLRFGQCIELSAQLLWNLSSEGLNKLRTGFKRLAPNVLNEARLLRQPGARFGQDLGIAFRIEGVPPKTAQKLMTTLIRTAQTIATHDNDWHVMLELARRFPQSIVVITHADLLAYLPGLSKGDLRDFGNRIFAHPEMVKLSQVVVQGSLDLVIRDDVEEPVWIKGPSADADELLTAVERQLVALTAKDHSLGRTANSDVWWIWTTAGSLLLPPLLIMLVLQPLTTFVVCGIFLAVWVTAFGVCHVFRNRSLRSPPATPEKKTLPILRPEPSTVREVTVDRLSTTNGVAVS